MRIKKLNHSFKTAIVYCTKVNEWNLILRSMDSHIPKGHNQEINVSFVNGAKLALHQAIFGKFASHLQFYHLEMVLITQLRLIIHPRQNLLF